MHGFARCYLANTRDQVETGTHRPLSVVLVRLRIPEIDQNSVAHVLGDKPGEARDRIGDAAVIGADNLSQILGIEALRQRRRADQIAEHHSQLAPLGLRRGLDFCWRLTALA